MIFDHEGRSKCARCLCSYNNKDPATKHWLQSQCTAQGSEIDRPIKLQYAHVHVGNNCAHVSHELHIYRGLIYCNKCGVRAGNFGVKLVAKPCGPPTEYGLQSLLALRQCKKPPSLAAWPSDLGGEECKQALKRPFRRGTISKGILLRIKRPKPVLNPTPLSSTVTSTMTAIPLKRNKPILSE